MKKNVLAWGAAVALASLASVGHAQTAMAQQVPFLSDAADASSFVVNPDGIGHVQLVPYYSSQGSRNTLLNIVNTDVDNGKVVKVRFRGARNSDDVFDFYVLLSPGDVWRSRVYRDGEQTKLESADNSCTWPLNFAANGGTAFPTTRVYQNLESELREGYVEILTAANVPQQTLIDGQLVNNPFYTAIKHVDGVAPCTESAIDQALEPLTTYERAQRVGLANPTTGLIAQWAISDVQTRSTVSGLTTTLLAVNSDNVAARGNIVVAPQLADAAPAAWNSPSTTGAVNARQGTADPLLLIWPQASYFDFPDLSTPYLGSITPDQQANRVSGALAVTEVINEFATIDADLQTDWVVSLPTRRYGVAIDYRNNSAIENVENKYFSIGAGGNSVLTSQNGAPPSLTINIQATYWDDEERSVASQVVISPGTPARESIRGEVSVFSFNANPENSLLGAQIAAQRINPSLNGQQVRAGWARVGLTEGGRAALAAGEARGLPVIGYAAVSSAGNSMSFTWPHRYNRQVFNGVTN